MRNVIFVHVLHGGSRPPDYPGEETIDEERYLDAMTRLQNMVPAAADFRRDPEIVIDSGVPADTVVNVARRTGADGRR